ncbi:MAG: hypothetical protein WAO08_38760 [Hyphomicrobiaceae bacterium]
MRPLSLGLGLIRQSGATAMVCLADIAGVKAGEMVVVSAAAAAVGSAVGQIATMKRCRAIGITESVPHRQSPGAPRPGHSAS